jgi:hemin uptake protein HemP
MTPNKTPPPPAWNQAHVPGPAKIEGAQLFAGQREIVIVHHGEQYRLRITRQEKLILTK